MSHFGLDAFRMTFAGGDGTAGEHLLELHYLQLRVVARRVLRDDRGRSVGRLMRQTRIDEVRRFKADRRQMPEVTTWLDGPDKQRLLPIDWLDDALTALFAIDADRARVVELRFYGGLTIAEIARETGQSESTVERRWQSALAWLLAELADAA